MKGRLPTTTALPLQCIAYMVTGQQYSENALSWMPILQGQGVHVREATQLILKARSSERSWPFQYPSPKQHLVSTEIGGLSFKATTLTVLYRSLILNCAMEQMQ